MTVPKPLPPRRRIHKEHLNFKFTLCMHFLTLMFTVHRALDHRRCCRLLLLLLPKGQSLKRSTNLLRVIAFHYAVLHGPQCKQTVILLVAERIQASEIYFVEKGQFVARSDWRWACKTSSLHLRGVTSGETAPQGRLFELTQESTATSRATAQLPR